MHWKNRNTDKYILRVIKRVAFSLTFVILLFSAIFLIKGSVSVISSSIIILLTFFLTSISWFKWAKYNIKSIEVGENEITIVFCQFDRRIETTCMVDEVLFEMRSRYKSKGYWAIYHIGIQI